MAAGPDPHATHHPDPPWAPFLHAEQLAIVDEVVALAAAGIGSAILVQGDRGSGKTALLGAAAAAATGLVLFGRAAEETRTTSYGVTVEPLGGQQVLVGTEQLLTGELDRLAGNGPVLLALDDLHLADDQTLVALQQLGLRLSSLPVVLVLSAATHDLPGELRRLVLVLSRQGLLTSVLLDAGAAPQPPAPDVPVTRGIASGSAVGGTESLSTATRHVLTLGSLLGARFAVHDLCVVTGASITDLLPQLREALDVGLVREAGERDLEFRSDHVRAAFYRDLPAPVRAELHREAALRLDQSGADVHAVAEHLLRAAVTPADSGWARDVAARVAPSSPLTTAVLLERLLPVVATDDARLDVEVALAEARLAAGHTREAEAAARDALRLNPAPGRAGNAHLVMSLALLRQARFEDARDWAEQAAAQPELYDEERAEQLAVAGMAALLGGDSDDALEAVARAERIAPASGGRRARIRGLTVRGHLAHLSGHLAAAEQLLAEAADLVEDDDSREAYDVGAQAFRAWALLDLDRVGQAREVVSRTVRAARARGATNALGAALLVDGCLALDTGSVTAAMGAFDAAAAACADDLGRLHPGAVARRALASLHRRGPHVAERLLQRLDEVEAQATHLFGYGWLVRARAAILLARDDRADSLVTLRRGWETCVDGGLLCELPVFGLELVDAAWQHDQPGLAAAVVDALDDLVARNPSVPTLEASALAARALAGEDVDLLVESVARWRSSPRRLLATRATEQVAARLVALRHRDLAEGLSAEVVRAYTLAGAAHDARRARALLRPPRGRPVGVPGPEESSWDALTRTERIVAEHLERGESNAEIARQLVLSRRTVESHVSHILTKLGLHSRADVMEAASRRAGVPIPPRPRRTGED
jgi:DNA-binding CsgD family transcriptional regulator/tetratricopeptide (TPR) repeat protein